MRWIVNGIRRMSAIIFAQNGNLNQQQELARQYWAVVDAKQVRAALRALMGKQTPDEFADAAGVDRSTIYRILKVGGKYSPKVETVSALVEAQGLTLSEFFLRIEGTHQPIEHSTGTASSARRALEFREQLSVAFLEAAAATSRATLRGLLTELAYALTEPGKPRQQAAAGRRDATGSAEGDRSAG